MDENEIGTTSEIEEVSIEDTIRDTWREISDRPRDEFGRFAKQAEEAAQPDGSDDEIEVEDAELEEIELEGLDDEQEAQAPADTAPSSWRKEAAAEWAKTPPAVRAEVLKREQDMHQGIAQYKYAADWAKQFEPLAQDLYKLRQAYGNEITGLKNLFQISNYANSDPVGFVQWFAKQRGIQLGGQSEQAPADPQYSALHEQVRSLQAELQAQKQAQESEVFQTLYREIEETKSKPGFEHFEELRGEMAGLLQSGLAKSLPEAYEKALWSRHDLRESLIAKQQQEAAAKAKAEALAKAKAAQKAASVNVQKRGTLNGKAPTGTMDDTIREAAARLGFIAS